MKYFLTVAFVMICFISRAQTCSCSDDYKFIKEHIEKNHGGFNKKIGTPAEPKYKAFTDNLEQEIKNDKNGRHCIAYLKRYILYLQDHHSNISGGTSAVNEDSAAAVNAFLNSPAYLNTEVIKLDSANVVAQLKNSLDPIEGIYYTGDKTYTIAVVKNKNKDRDYVGIILNSKTRLWSTGQVKMELKQVSDSSFEIYNYLRNHGLLYDQLPYHDGQLQLAGWTRDKPTATGKKAAIDNELIKFTVLDSSTTLLSIRSFDAGLYKKLDSVYKQVIPVIKKYPHFIIDVRNNGGGSDQSYSALMPLIYTDPFESDVVEYFSTPANIKAYQDYDDKMKRTASANQDVFKAQIAKMKTVEPYHFVTMGNGQPFKVAYPKNDGYPEKIAVLYNRNCASSCESLLFEVMNSKKSIMVGENSGGYTGYGNVMNIQTPCGNTLSWTTSVYREQWKYEFVGIPPQYKISPDESDWVDYTRRLLNK